MTVDAQWIDTIIREVEAEHAKVEILTGTEVMGAAVAREYMKEHPEDLAEIHVRAIVDATLWIRARTRALDRASFEALRHTFKGWIDCAVGNGSVHRSSPAYAYLYEWVVSELPPEPAEAETDEDS